MTLWWVVDAPIVALCGAFLISRCVAAWKRRRDERSYRRFLSKQRQDLENRLYRNELFRDYVRTNHFKPYDASNG